jgi:hypothetical protein
MLVHLDTSVLRPHTGEAEKVSHDLLTDAIITLSISKHEDRSKLDRHFPLQETTDATSTRTIASGGGRLGLLLIELVLDWC